MDGTYSESNFEPYKEREIMLARDMLMHDMRETLQRNSWLRSSLNALKYTPNLWEGEDEEIEDLQQNFPMPSQIPSVESVDQRLIYDPQNSRSGERPEGTLNDNSSSSVISSNIESETSMFKSGAYKESDVNVNNNDHESNIKVKPYHKTSLKNNSNVVIISDESDEDVTIIGSATPRTTMR